MTKTNVRNLLPCSVLAAAAMALGCSPGQRNQVESRNQALTTSNGLFQNGLFQNGLSSNGLFQNGLFQNGLFQNGLFQNGLFQNGLFQNGLFQNGLFQNGLFQNGVWVNGLFQNGVWQKGLTGDAALPGDTLRGSAYARQLLQYIYSCAMPATTFDTSLDPNNGTLLCSGPDGGAEGGADGGAECDVGYTCSSTDGGTQGTCVVPLKGAIGIGINANGTSWGASGTCDESCQRWVTACVLARTNAYGVHVEISMRAPDDAPDAVKAALALASGEGVSCPDGSADDPTCGYTLREGAYYGNIFGTTPVNPAPSATYSGPAIGPIAQTPVFYACAGPDSNTPEITKRFCSSQGDQSVINVPGVCWPAATGATEPPVCDGIDASGSIFGCYTSADTTVPRAHYDQVITVYLKQPIAVCGNEVCEPPAEDATSCPSDCHPVGWALSFPGVASGIQGIASSDFHGSSAVSPIDDTIVFVGQDLAGRLVETQPGGDLQFVGTDVSLGGPVLPGNGGNVVVAKYTAAGDYVWSTRFELPDGEGTPIVAVAGDGSIFISGFTVLPAGLIALVRLAKLTSDGQLVTGWPITFGNGSTPGGADQIAVDSVGNVFLAGLVFGTSDISLQITPPVSLSGLSGGSTSIFAVKVLPDGTLAWAAPIPGGAGTNTVNSLTIAPSGDLLLAVHSTATVGSVITPEATALYRLSATNGASVLLRESASAPELVNGEVPPVPAYFTTVAADGSGDLYVTGYLTSTYDFGQGCGTETSTTGSGEFFLAKYSSGGSQCSWVKRATTTCPPGALFCADGIFEGGALSFDPEGNVLVGGTLASLAGATGPGIGAIVDFGAGPFPTYRYPNPFVASYDPSGNFLWAKQIPIVLQGNLEGLNLDSHNNVFVSGIYTGSMQIDDRLLIDTIPELNDDQHANTYLGSFTTPSSLDKTPPAIGAGTDQNGTPIHTVPNDILAQATSSCGASVFFMPPTAIDLGDPAAGAPAAGTSVVCSPAPNTTFAIGQTTVTCTASDAVGNHSDAKFQVTVVDTIAPLITQLPAPIPVQATGPTGAIVTYSAPVAADQVDCSSASSSCTPSPNPCITAHCAPASGSTFAIGTTTVSCTATDAHNNTSTATFLVTVTPPPVTVSCVGAPGAPRVIPTAPGVCGVVVSNPSTLAGTCGGAGLASCTFAGLVSETIGPGDHAVVVAGIGVDGSTTSCTSYIRVTDGEKPSVTCARQTVQCTGKGGATVTPGATCTDNCSCATSCATALFPVGTSSGACTATDPSGNSATCQPVITVVDSTPPVVTPRSGPSQLQCHVDTWSDPGATAFDQCVGDLSAGVRVGGSVDPTHVGSYTVTYSVTDPSGNAASAARSVSVVDTLPPTTSATVGPNPPGNRYINIDITSYSVTPKGGGTAVTGTADCWTSPGIAITLNAVDACSLKQITYALTGAQTGGASVAGCLASVTIAKMGSTTVSYYATDNAGNTGATNTLPIFVGHGAEGFGFSCAPSPSLKTLPPHGTVTAKGTVTITNSLTGKKVTEAFSFTQSY